MKKIILLTLLCNISFAQITENKFVSNITNVTVFLTGAELTHEAKVKVKKGKNTIKLTGLSAKLDNRTINLNPGSADITVLYLNTETNYFKNGIENNAINTIKDSIEFYSDKLSLLNFEQDALKTEKELMFKDASFGGKAGITPVDAEKNADFYRKRSTEINLMLFKNNKQITKLTDIKNKYKKQFIDYNAQYNPPTTEISITLNSNKDFETNMLLKYVIASAGWSPKYDIRTNSTSNDVKLIFRAMAFNNSGLDWKDVKLTLSTASPNFGIKVPTLSKWYLGSEQMAEQEELTKYVQVQAGELYDKIESGKMELNEVQIATNGVVGYDNARFLDDVDKQQIKKGKQKQMNANSDVKFNKIEVDAISNEFEVKDTYTILSDAKPYTVDVLERDAKGTFEYKALPSIEKEVFLQTKLALKDLPDLVSGEANVYFGGSYIGKTTIKTIDLEDSLLVSLGRDKKVQLQRKEIKQEYSRSIVGNNEKTISKFETTFKNNREVTILLTVEDQIPLANNSDQEINLNEADGATYDKASGKLIWKLELKAGESRTIKMGYTAKYPKGTKTRYKKYRTISSPSF